MSILQKYLDLDECEQWNFIDHIKEINMDYLIRVVNKHYAQQRKEYYKKRYKENPEYRKKIAEANKKYKLKKKMEREKNKNIDKDANLC